MQATVQRNDGGFKLAAPTVMASIPVRELEPATGVGAIEPGAQRRDRRAQLVDYGIGVVRWGVHRQTMRME